MLNKLKYFFQLLKKYSLLIFLFIGFILGIILVPRRKKDNLTENLIRRISDVHKEIDKLKGDRNSIADKFDSLYGKSK